MTSLKKIKKNFFLLTLIASFVACLFSCKREVKESIYFNVDSSLLGEKIYVNDNAYAIRIPKDFAELEKEKIFSLKALENLTNANREDSVLIFKIFSDTAKSYFLIISNLKLNRSYEKFLETLEAEFNNNKTDYLKANYVKDNIDVTQFIIQKQGIIDFKFLVSIRDREILQVDYFFLKNKYNEQAARIVESSFGSLSYRQN